MLRLWKRSLLVLAASGVVVAFVTPSAGAALSQKDACELLKPSELEDLLGQEVGKPEELGDTCFWDLEDPDAGTEGIALLVDRGRGARFGYEQGLDALRPDAVTEVDGVGKEAYFAINSIAVLKNQRTALYLSGVYDQAHAEELARIAVRRA